MGEGAGGVSWPLCQGINCGIANTMDDPDNPGQPIPANHQWISGEPGDNDLLDDENGIQTNGFFSTNDQLNKNPVTDAFMNIQNDRRTDQRECSNFAVVRHRVSNVRSDHPGGGNFLFADGAVRFISQYIMKVTEDGYLQPPGALTQDEAIRTGALMPSGARCIGTYEALSTIAGGESIGEY